MIAAAAGLVFPLVIGYLLDAAFELKDRSALDRIALALLGIFAIQGLANFVQVYLLSATTERVVARLREDTFAHLVHLSPAFFTERRTGELTSRLSSDLALLQSLLGTWVSELSRQILFLVGGIGDAHGHQPRPHAHHAGRGADRGRGRHRLRPCAPPSEHGGAGPHRRGHGHGRRGLRRAFAPCRASRASRWRRRASATCSTAW